VINVSWYDAIEYCNWLSEQHGLTPYYAIDKTRKDANNKNDEDKLKWTVTPASKANGYRLPTEAEWEYAAREGGKEVRFGHGKSAIDPKEINFNASKDYKKDYSVVGEYRGKTVPVGSLNSSNALGLHDMSGNVWEWCWDWYGSYPTGVQNNPVGAEQGVYRVIRGGGWNAYPQFCRAASRFLNAPTDRISLLGFRLARS
jgi:formylglycine-generating enzyme required for sulfatase activity